MENVLLIVELIIALFLIIVVLLQRSEGGALGMGGGGGGGGVVSGRGAATALTKLTWILAAGFFVVALSLTVMAAQRASERSVINGTAVEDIMLPDDPDLDNDLKGLIAPPPGANPLIPPVAE